MTSLPPLNQIDPTGYTILVADDMENSLRSVTMHLREIGFRILTAYNRESMLQRAEYAQPDLILLDIAMQNFDSIDACSILKNRPETTDIPIIFVTGLTDLEHKVKTLFQVGGVDYITKPIQFEELQARMATHLRLRDLTQNQAEQALILESTKRELHKTLHDLNRTQAKLIKTVKAKDELNSVLQKSNQELETQVSKQALELKEAKKKSEVANRAKSIFLAQISHQLRTPLNAILGFTQLVLSDNEIIEKQKERLTVVYENGVDLLNLLNQIIQVTETEVTTQPHMRDEILISRHADISSILEEHQRIQAATKEQSEPVLEPLPNIETLHEWLVRLEEAVMLLEMDEIFDLAKKVHHSHPDLSKTLQYWANDFEYHKILTWIKDVKRQENIE